MELLQAGLHHVLPDGHLHRGALVGAVLGHQAQAVAHALLGAVALEGLALQGDGAAVQGAHAVGGLHHLGTAGAHQAEDAHDLALAHGHAAVLDPLAGLDVLQVEDLLAGLGGVAVVVVADLTAHHLLDQLVHGGVLQLGGADVPAVPEHGHPVADAVNLLHTVRDIEDSHVALEQLVHHAEELLNLIGGQGGGGFVHDDDLGVVRYRLGNFHDLPLTYAQVQHQSVRIDIDLQILQNSFALLIPLPVVDHPPALEGLVAQEDVGGNGLVQQQVEFLVDNVDAQLLGLLGVLQMNLLPLVVNASAVRLVNAC